jgi:hypothetical protein
MSRAQEQQVADTAQGQNKTFNTNAQDAFTGANNSITAQQGDVNQYSNQLSQFAAANPYGAGGAFQTATNTATAGAADAGSQAAAQAAQAAAVRTGQNASGGVAAGVAADQSNTRNLMTEQAKANADRITQGAGYGAKVLQASEVPATLQGAITGEQGKLATAEADAGNQSLGIDQRASDTPSELELLQQGVMKAGEAFAGGAGAAMCPARGSLYLMADGTEKAVESLEVGEYIAGIDGDSVLIEEIQSAESPVLRIETDDGHVLTCSRVHAFAQPVGGFVVAMHSMGKMVLTSSRSKIVSVDPAGSAKVFNIITDGSHTYRANGMWSLGVGEAERQVSMDRWNSIGEKMEAAHG